MISNIMQIQSIVIGKRGENNAVVHDFDLSEFVTKWGSGTATLLHKRPNDTRPYLVSGAVQDSTANALTWTVSSADTAQAGEGELEIRWTITGGLAKSARFKTIITDSLVDETTEQPGAVVYMGDGSQITQNKNDIAQIKEDILALQAGSGSGSSNAGAGISMTQAEYDALTDAQKTSGLYFITDTDSVYASGKWSGKKWVCVGDSLTEANSKTTMHYHDYVANKTGISVVNMGVSGTGYRNKLDDGISFYNRVDNIPTDADVVTIFGSGNDVSIISSLGTITDTTTDTICGCVNLTIDKIINLIPTVALGIVAPTPWKGNKPTADDSNAMAKYVDALKQICKVRSIPFLDLYHCSNLRPWTEEGRTACYSKDGTNGVHPDESGHALIAPRFESFLDSIMPY